MKRIFITGMLRSGTSLIQVLLTNHPELFVVYQPFFQFYVKTRQHFLEEHNLEKLLPLGDGLDCDEEERNQFRMWLRNRHFDCKEAVKLIAESALAKGCGIEVMGGKIAPLAGTFEDIQSHLHRLLAGHSKKNVFQYIGSKEVLCEEYIPALIDQSVRCLIIIRDPRAMIASACHGRYRDEVGDCYPLLMLIRLWRKSAGYWLAYCNHPLVHAIRYEDLTKNADVMLREITRWLDILSFPVSLIRQPLFDHTGRIWRGNSSFGDKTGVDASAEAAWKSLLTPEEIRFIEACTKPEMEMLGYAFNDDLQSRDISDFQEDTSGVREAYLSHYRLNAENREIELLRWDAVERNQYSGRENAKLFIFPEVFLIRSESAVTGSTR